MPLMLVMCVSCSYVTTEKPVCDACSVSDRSLFEGFWMTEDGVFEIRFDASGVAHFGAMDWSEPDGNFSSIVGELQCSATPRLDTSAHASRMIRKWILRRDIILQSTRFESRDRMIVSIPKPERFIEWITSGKLQGETTVSEHSKSVHLTSQPAEYVSLLKTDGDTNCFDETEPLVFHRIMLPKATEVPTGVQTPAVRP